MECLITYHYVVENFSASGQIIVSSGYGNLEWHYPVSKEELYVIKSMILTNMLNDGIFHMSTYVDEYDKKKWEEYRNKLTIINIIPFKP